MNVYQARLHILSLYQVGKGLPHLHLLTLDGNDSPIGR